MTKSEVLKLSVQLTSAIVSNPAITSHSPSSDYIQQLINDCSNAVRQIAYNMGISIQEEVPIINE
jgi:hypothetical protein